LFIGCARASTQEQNLEPWADALSQAGCERFFKDQLSGASTDRPAKESASGACMKASTRPPQAAGSSINSSVLSLNSSAT
jgi:hypothetical protein